MPGRSPEGVIQEADDTLGPFIARFCLFSGGGDSQVVAHRCRDRYDELVFIDTGTSVPGVIEFVREFAAWLDRPLRIMGHEHDAWRALVLTKRLGFPGPAQHGRAYNQLTLPATTANRRAVIPPRRKSRGCRTCSSSSASSERGPLPRARPD